MVNFMCQLDRAMRCSDSWSNIILGVFKRKFLDQTNIKSRLFPIMWAASSNQLKVQIEESSLFEIRTNLLTFELKCWHFFFFSCLLTQTITLSFPGSWIGQPSDCNYTISFPVTILSGFWTQTGTKPLTLLGLQFADSPFRSWDSLAPP